MQKIKIAAIETANPAARWSQQQVLESVRQNEQISKKARVFYQRFLSDAGIQTRHFGMQTLSDVNTESPDEAQERFEKVATEIGTEAVRKCLGKAKVAVEDVDALIVTTCTGYLCPGLTSYVAEAAGMKDSVYALDLAGLGCGAALPALRSARQYLQAHPQSNVMVLCVEVCSAALSWGDEIDLILSNALFADGAAACLLSNQEGARGYEILEIESLLWPEYRDQLRFKKKDSRLCNVINRSVPEIAAKAVKELNEKIKGKLRGVPEHYGVHPGGRRILDEIESAAELKEGALEHSRGVLAAYGNMSSPSILYVLKAITENARPKKDEHVALFAFGAGFSAFGALLQSDGLAPAEV